MGNLLRWAGTLLTFGAGGAMTGASVIWPSQTGPVLFYGGIALILLGVVFVLIWSVRDYEVVLRKKGGTPRVTPKPVPNKFFEYEHAVRPLDTSEGRRAFCNVLVMYHGQGVSELQTGKNAQWQTFDQMMDWLQRDGQWVGELIGAMRAFDCEHSEIHDIGVLGPPRHIAAYAAPVHFSENFLKNVDRYQSFLAERLHRIKDLIKKYEPTPVAR